MSCRSCGPPNHMSPKRRSPDGQQRRRPVWLLRPRFPVVFVMFRLHLRSQCKRIPRLNSFCTPFVYYIQSLVCVCVCMWALTTWQSTEIYYHCVPLKGVLYAAQRSSGSETQTASTILRRGSVLFKFYNVWICLEGITSFLIAKAAEPPAGGQQTQKASLGESVWYPSLIFTLDFWAALGAW